MKRTTEILFRVTLEVATIVAAGFVVAEIYAQQQRPQPRAIRLQLEGKIVTHRAAELPRFQRANGAYPRYLPPHPADYPGHVWRWSPWHGYVLLPVAQAPVELVLPLDYALPQTVIAYQQPANVAQVTCPHCGQAFNVELP